MKTNKFNLIILCICYFLSQTANAQNADNFIGIWENKEKTISIEIYKLENSYYGKLLKTTFKTDVRNINADIIIQMKKDSEKVLFGGTYFDLTVNEDYEIKIKLTDNNQFYMKRYHRLFNKRHHWHRVINL